MTEHPSLDLSPNLPIQSRRFLRRALHDLAAPARHVTAFSEFARESMVEPINMDECSESLDVIERAADEMQRLITSLSTFLKLPDQMGPTTACCLRECIQEAWHTALKQSTSESCSIDALQTVAIGEQPGDDSISIHTDADLLKKILTELLSNCVVHADSSRPLVVQPTLRQDENVVTIHIADNGIGFDPEVADRLCLPFERLGTGKERRPGAGLGLTTVTRCLELLGGSLELNSEQHVGTTAMVTLPKTSQAIV